MPPLGMHMVLAREMARELRDPALAEAPGAYYLGATTPDIRVLTRWDRQRTHFFDLNNFEEQCGVEALFAAYPELAERERLDTNTVAFLAGYISHLEMDEVWICEVYRPCFGERSPLKGDVLANVLDRVLQFELDRRGRDDPKVVQEIRDDLLAASVDVAVRFLDRETLARWRDISVDILNQRPDWERFKLMASRHLRAYGVESEEDLQHFLRNVPDLLEQAIREVTPERLATFQELSRQRALEAMRSYLT